MEKYQAASSSFYKSIVQSFYGSIDGQYVDIFESLNTFLHERLYANYQNDDIDSFSVFANLFIYYYEYSVRKYRGLISDQEIHEVCSEAAARGIKEMIVFGLKFNKNSSEIKHKTKDNLFSEVLLSKLSNIIYTSIKYKDIRKFSFFLNQLNQIYSNSYDQYRVKLEVSFLQNKKLNQEEQDQLKILEERLYAGTFIDNIVRRIFKVVRFWTYYLFSIEILNHSEIKEINDIFEQYNLYIESEQLEDIYYLRASSYHGDNTWNEWDYVERPEMEVYTPPSALHWVTFGSLIYFLKDDGAISYNIEDKNPEHIKSFEYFISSMAEMLLDLEKNGYEKWHSIFNTPSKEDFDKRILSFKQQVDYLRKVNVTGKEKSIADQPLHQPIITAFSDTLIAGWSNKNSIRELFTYFRNTNNLEKKPEGAIQIGEKNLIKEDWKKHFIQDQNFATSIGNVNLLGHQLAKVEEKVFINQILDDKKLRVLNLLIDIDKSIHGLTNLGFTPSVILITHSKWTTTFANLRHPDFELNWNKDKEFPFSEYGGVYKKILIIALKNGFLKNNVIVADFFESFELDQYVQSGNPVMINISLITTEEAGSIVDTNSSYWLHNNISRDEAIIKVRNAVKFDFYSLLKFNVKQREAYDILTTQ
ncbi:MAG: hypothetical protein JWQ38_1419 [Flavipsychrobacter sp.]|nr:hypothetical protein [Flavipsychrobacter sp.]